MKNAIKILFLAYLVSMVSASNDARVLIDTKDGGLCLAVDRPDVQYCQNETVLIDGTSDHMLYIVPQSSIKNPSNASEIGVYAMTAPLSFIVSSFGFFIVLVFIFIGLIVVLYRRISPSDGYRRRR
jgi:hypothetical protein